MNQLLQFYKRVKPSRKCLTFACLNIINKEHHKTPIFNPYIIIFYLFIVSWGGGGGVFKKMKEKIIKIKHLENPTNKFHNAIWTVLRGKIKEKNKAWEAILNLKWHWKKNISEVML